jgi:hypothetical protein
MKILDIPQNSDKWREIRLGKFTASLAYRLCGKKGLGDGGLNYAMELASEDQTGMPAKDSFDSKYTEHGHVLEPEAREHYIMYCNMVNRFLKPVKSELHGFAISDFSDEVGCSIDTFVSPTNTIAEIKCTYNNVNHFKHRMVKTWQDLKEMKTGSTKGVYYWQMQHQLLVYGAKHADFVSYNPNFSDKRLHIVGIPAIKEDQEFLYKRLQEAIKLKHELLMHA